MTKKRKILIQCRHCGEEFEIDKYDIIDSNDTPELRQAIIDNAIFEHYCPNCNQLNVCMQQFFYIDDVNNFKIQFAPKGLLIDYVVPKDSKYIEVGCDNGMDLISKIICFENDIDYVAEKVVKILAEGHTQSKVEDGSIVDFIVLINDEDNGLGYFVSKEKEQ